MKKGEMIRKTAIAAMAFLFVGIIIVSLTQIAPGDYQVAGDFITVDPKASGTKLTGTLLIYYETDCANYLNAKYFFIRLQKGNDLYRYSGSFTGGIDIENTTDQEGVIFQYFENKIIPELFPNANSFALKSYSKLVTQDPLCGDNFEPSFAMFDFVIAVK